MVACSALGGLLVSASWLLAHELALGARAESRLLALPVALGLLAHGGADGIGSSACSAALCRGAHSLALRAISRLAEVLRAANVALGLVTVDLAGCAWGLFAVDLALWSLAYRVALSWAGGIIALPSALWVASRGRSSSRVRFHLALHLHVHSRDAAHKEGEHREQNKSSLHF